MIRRLFFLFFLLPLLGGAQSFPAYDNVVYRFYAAYHANNNPDVYLSFAKKKDGWHVIEISVHDPSVVTTDGLFWSKADSSWKNPGFPKGTSHDAFDEINRFTSHVSRYNYSRLPYYGYPGWDLDIITDFGSVSLLNDTLTESKSRAFSSRAYDWVSHPYDYTMRPGKSSTKEECISQFILHMEKAIAFDRELMSKFPQYQSLTGNAATRYANNVMGMYEQLSYYGKEKDAEKYFAQPLYDNMMKAQAKNLLESCEKNALLFVSGDNEYYPLRYLQITQKTRTDVTVVNTGLLEFPEKIAQLAKDTSVRMFIPNTAYADSSYLVVVGSQSVRDSVSCGKWFSGLMQDSAMKNLPGVKGKFRFAPDAVPVISAADLIAAKRGLFAAYDVSLWKQNFFSPTLNFWSRSRLAAIDLVLSNMKYRPVYYSSSCDPYEYWFGMQYNDEGLLYRVMPVAATQFMSSATAQMIYDRYMQKISADTVFSDTVNAKIYAAGLREVFTSMASSLQQSGKNDLAEKAADRIQKLLPPKYFPPDPVMASLVNVYYDAGKSTKGDALSNSLLSAFEKELTQLKQAYDRNSSRRRNEIMNAVDMIERKARQKQRSTISEKARNIQKNFGNE